MMIVCGSPFLPFTSRNPSAPAPPALLTTMMGRGDSLCLSEIPAMSRAIWSAPPPVPAGTTNSIGLVGSQAAAGSTPASTTATTSRADTRRWYVIVGPPCPKGVPTKHGGVRRRSAPDPAAGNLRPDAQSLRLLDVQGSLGGVHPLERHHGRHFPLVPHLVHLGLEV